MIKYKYLKLTKEEQKEARDKFFSTKRGKELKVRFNRLLIYAVCLLFFGIYLIIDAYINKKIAGYIYGGIIIIFGIGFIIGRHKVMIKQINDNLVKKDKKKNK